ncbi:MAG: aldehyde dehydrogenase family protein [Bacteroidota bacterium]
MMFGYKRLYIDGQLVDAGDDKGFDVICPGTEAVVARIAWAGKDDTEKALQAAAKGFDDWSALPVSERVEWMLKLRDKILENRDLLRSSIMHEMGKTWENTDEDLTSIADSLQYYAEEITRRDDIVIPDKEGTHQHRLISQPLGVVVAFLAYNFPLLNLGFKLGPALAAGCSIILKPSEYSPLSAYIIGELCHEIDFPAGVINVLCGEVAEVGIPLCESTIPRLITMIGSTETAQKLIAQSSKTSIKRYSMECGGNAPFIVFEDADVEKAIALGGDLKLGNAGQTCVSPNRYFIHEAVIDAFTKELVERFQQTKIGFGQENQPDMGPLANQQSVDRMEKIIEEAIGQGAEIQFGGKALEQSGYYFQPSVLRLDDPHAAILQKEIFGPIAMIVPFKTKEEALQLANATNVGLASYVYTRDEQTQAFFADKLEFGEIQLNGVKYDIYLPHGGIKNSGIGVDCSPYALDDYLIRKRVSLALG